MAVKEPTEEGSNTKKHFSFAIATIEWIAESTIAGWLVLRRKTSADEVSTKIFIGITRIGFSYSIDIIIVKLWYKRTGDQASIVPHNSAVD
jgi:hypothetical protein